MVQAKAIHNPNITETITWNCEIKLAIRSFSKKRYPKRSLELLFMCIR